MECGGQPWFWVDAGAVTTVENTSEEGNSDLSFGRNLSFLQDLQVGMFDTAR